MYECVHGCMYVCMYDSVCMISGGVYVYVPACVSQCV